jgi:hypothetical protein
MPDAGIYISRRVYTIETFFYTILVQLINIQSGGRLQLSDIKLKKKQR